MNPSQTQTPTELFETLFQAVEQDLLEAIINFRNWEALWMPTDEGIQEMFNGFFLPTRPALIDRSFIKSYNVVDPSNAAPSLYRLFKCVQQDPSLAPTLHTTQLRRRLKRQNSFIKRLKNYRDLRAAHSNTELTPASFDTEEYRSFLGELQGIFQEIYTSHTGHEMSFHLWEIGGTKDVLDSLVSYLSLREAAIQVTFHALKDNSDPNRYFVPSQLLEALHRETTQS